MFVFWSTLGYNCIFWTGLTRNLFVKWNFSRVSQNVRMTCVGD